jgi:DNA topoisomerase-3
VVVYIFKNYGGANWKKTDAPCDFVIWKTIAGKKISPKAAGYLLSGKTAGPFKGFISKKKKRFSACLQLVHEQGRWQVRFVFDTPPSPEPRAPVNRPERPKKSSPKTDTGELGTCPVCGAKIVEGNRGYGCSHWRKSDGGCNFVIWKTFKGKKLTPANIKALVGGKKTRTRVFTTEDGRKIKARLILEQKNDHTWEPVLVDI